MRNIFPQDKNTSIFPQGHDTVTREDLNIISNRITEAQEAIDLLETALQDYKTENAGSINTRQLNAINAVIESLQTPYAEIDSLKTHLVESDNIRTQNLESVLVNATDRIVSATGQFTNLNATDTVTADRAVLNTVEAVNWVIQNLDVGAVNTTDVNADTIRSNKVINQGKVTTDSLESNTASIASLTSDSLEVKSVNTEGLVSEEINTSNIVWKDEQTVSNQEYIWIEIPHFENGEYYLQVESEGKKILTVEVLNSVDNYFVRYSQNPYGTLETVYKVDEGQNARVILACHNASRIQWNMKNATMGVMEDVGAPKIYTYMPWEEPVSGIYTHKVYHKNGGKFFEPVALYGSQEEHDYAVLDLYPRDDWENTDATTVMYNGTLDTEFKLYRPDQEVNTDSDVQFNKLETTDTTKLNSHFFIGTETEWNTAKTGMRNDSLVFIGV